jgi:choline dehydrogenase
LQQYNIPVLSDLPGVGQNLMDQILFPVIHAVNVPTAAEFITEPQNAQKTVEEYLDFGTGALSSMNGFIAFEKIPKSLRTNFTAGALADLAKLPADWPEVEYVSNSAVEGGTGLGVMLACLSAPVSRGNVTINSADPNAPPVINLGWLSDPNSTDAQVATAAFKRLRQAWAAITAITLGTELVPGPAVATDAQILAYIRGAVSTIYHAAATNAMGTNPSAGAVVDSHARVFGVKGLRVVDNSASPFAVPGHPQSTVYALAEKIAALIQAGG